jgi:type IX secretion system PorP/SprF family membrane protein
MRAIIGLLTSALLLLFDVQGSGQNLSVYNSYFVNPYFYNPAEAATDFTFVHINHRQQWMGFEGAPKISSLTFTTLLNETRTGIGFKATSFTRGLLQTKDFSATYAYGVPLSTGNTMYFGLSGGAISNAIDMTGIDVSDPALSSYMANNIQPAANFGMLFRSASGINLGVSLPQMFEAKFNNNSNFDNPSFSPVDNIFFSAYYKRKVEGKLVSKKKGNVRAKVKTEDAIAPLEFYMLYRYSKTGNSQAEGTVKYNFSERFWLSALYRQSYGFAGGLGFSFNNILVNYSYEPGSQPQPKSSTGSHEFHLGLKIGELKKLRRPAPVIRSTIKTVNSAQHFARFQQTVEDPDNEDNGAVEKKKYYLVVKSFPEFVQADVYKKKLVAEKFNADVFYYEKEKKFYVFIFESPKMSEIHTEARNLKNFTKLKNVKILTVVIPKN